MRKVLLLLLLVWCTGVIPVAAQQKPTTTKKQPATSKTTPKKATPATQKKQPQPAKTTQANSKAGMIAASKLDTFKLQVTPLVKTFENALNYLKDKRTSVQERQTIITESYLKWCWDDKVQVEDDLDAHRLVPIAKDMRAYLSDVDFFFRSARFQYMVQDVSVETDQQGLTYFKVTANRSLKAIDLKGDSVNNNQVRYIEINFDSVKQQLKIKSVYTTKLNEKDDLRNWWNGLAQNWKDILAKDMQLGSMPMAKVENFNDTVARSGGVTQAIDKGQFYQYLSQIIQSGRVDISGNRQITSIEPLGKLSGLREVNLSGTGVSDLMPLRNLNKLENLDISATNVTSLEPLRFCLLISQLRMRGIPVSDLSIVSTFSGLTVLDLNGTQVTSLEPLEGLAHLKDLRINHTRVKELAPVSALAEMEMLNISSTPVETLDPVKGMTNLNILLCDSTMISSLAPLDALKSMQRVYCNNTRINQKAALSFLKKHPDVSLVYASKELAAWWKGMSSEWQNLFNFYVKMGDTPTTEQLHKLALLDSINITGRMTITSLDPLQKLILLRNLQCQSTGISSLAPLSELSELQVINASNTKVADLQPLAGLENLEVLNFDNTPVGNLSPLYTMKQLKFVFADNTAVNPKEADNFFMKNPGCMLVFQTFDNRDWWKNLSPAWKEILLQQVEMKGDPDKIQLQQIAGMTKFSVAENTQLTDLAPLQHLARLAELQFSGTSVSKLDPLSRMARLQVIRCPKNPVSDLAPIAGLPNLKELDFSNTLVEDLEAIQNMMQLEVLKFSGTQVKNLKYLQKLVNLKVLEFYNSRVGNVDVLEGMSKLESVKMFKTKVSEKRVEKLKQVHPKCEIIFY